MGQAVEVIQAAKLLEHAPAGKNDYAALKAAVKEAELLEPQHAYYEVKLAYTLAMLAVGVTMLVLLTGWLRVILIAPYMAFVCVQVAFLSHDFGHKQVFGSTRLNTWVGMLLANLTVGMSLGGGTTSTTPIMPTRIMTAWTRI